MGRSFASENINMANCDLIAIHARRWCGMDLRYSGNTKSPKYKGVDIMIKGYQP